MPMFERGEVAIHYVERGRGFPVLLFAPGGMRSAADFWPRAPFDPMEVLSDRFRVIAMDQRNAGRSRAPITGADGWHSYAADHVALLDHLGIERCHLLGGCIGGPYCMGVIAAAPGRVAAAVLQQPIGTSPENRTAFYDMFDAWRREIAERHPNVSDEEWRSFRSNMYDGDFLFNVDRDFVKRCETPLLVLRGNDLYHPEAVSREIVALAPDAELVEDWKEPGATDDAVRRVRSFLEAHTPASARASDP